MRDKYGDVHYSDNTLKNMTKEELIEQIRILEHNHEVLHERLDNQATNFPKLLNDYLEEFTEYCYINGISFSYCVKGEGPCAAEINRKIISKFYDTLDDNFIKTGLSTINDDTLNNTSKDNIDLDLD